MNHKVKIYLANQHLGLGGAQKSLVSTEMICNLSEMEIMFHIHIYTPQCYTRLGKRDDFNFKPKNNQILNLNRTLYAARTNTCIISDFNTIRLVNRETINWFLVVSGTFHRFNKYGQTFSYVYGLVNKRQLLV